MNRNTCLSHPRPLVFILQVADEVEHLENFYGKCHPMPLEEA